MEAPMLVLSRKIGEQILIGDSVVVTVVRINPQEVRIGIEAPSEVEIVRTELVATAHDSSEPALGR
jgi:carbon storage regulator